MAKKINSEYKIDNDNKSIIVTMGTSDKKNPEVIYSVLSTYVTPNTEDFDDEIFNEVPKKIKKSLKTSIKQFGICENDIIVVTDVATSRMFCGKQSYFDMQIYFKPQKDILTTKNKKFKDISDNIYSTYVKDIATSIENTLSNNGFKLSKNKNKATAESI